MTSESKTKPILIIEDEALLGMEAKNRTDWKVIPESASQDDQNIADALNYKLNQAEKRSRVFGLGHQLGVGRPAQGLNASHDQAHQACEQVKLTLVFHKIAGDANGDPQDDG